MISRARIIFRYCAIISSVAPLLSAIPQAIVPPTVPTSRRIAKNPHDTRRPRLSLRRELRVFSMACDTQYNIDKPTLTLRGRGMGESVAAPSSAFGRPLRVELAFAIHALVGVR